MLSRWDEMEVIRFLKTQYVLKDQNLWVHYFLSSTPVLMTHYLLVRP